MKASALWLALAMTFGTAAVPRAQEPAPDQSLERMRAVLQRTPLRLTPVEPEANFKIHIEAIHPMHDIFEKPPWQLDPGSPRRRTRSGRATSGSRARKCGAPSPSTAPRSRT